MRPVTPLAVENGVGKLAAHVAPNASPGKRASASGSKRDLGRIRKTTSKLPAMLKTAPLACE
jgi:hypothetical protein